MSTNAASLRRILRSIGSHATPSSTTTRTSTNLHPPNTRAVSQYLAPSVQCHDATPSHRQSGGSRQYQGIRPFEQIEANHRQIAVDSTATEHIDGTGGHHAGVGRVHVNGPHSALGESEKGTIAADADEARHPPASGEDPIMPIRRLYISDEKAIKLYEADARAENDRKLYFRNKMLSQQQQQQERRQLRIKKEGEFSRGYFKALEETKKINMKKRARRHQLLKARHTKDDERLWPDIMRLLEQDSPRGPKHYIKRTETIRLPEGIYAKWTADPGESILEVMQRTGTHVQVVPTKEIGLFSSLKLLGKPTQNHAAKRLLQDSNLLQAVSQDDVNASKSLADYELRSEFSDHPDEATGEVDQTSTNDLQLRTRPDDLGFAQLQAAVDDTTGRAPTRAVWSFDATDPGPDAPREYKTNDGVSVVETPSSFAPMSATSLTVRIEEMTADVPRRPRQGEFHDRTDLVCDELVALLTNPEHVAFITPAALSSAMNYLARHMHFPSVRGILDALKDVKMHVSADVVNPLLAAAAQSENVLAFHYIVQAMRERNIAPDADTWVQFHTLMLKRFPEESKQVVVKMQENAIQSNLSAKIDNLESYAAVLLEAFMNAHPGATIKEYINLVNNDLPMLKWFTTFTANRMCHSLIKKGKTIEAFKVVDELVRQGGRPDTVTLNCFISSAKAEGNMEMAVAILRKFHDLHKKSTALAETDKDGKPTKLQRKHDLSIKLNRITLRLLFDIAWDRKQYNCLRVFWRYACCAGILHNSMSVKISKSALSPTAANSSFDAKKIIEHKKYQEGGSRGRLWQAFAGKFAIGVVSGLESRKSLYELITSNDSATTGDSTSLAEGGNESDQKPPPLPPTASLTVMRALPRGQVRAAFHQDRNEAYSLRPKRRLVDLVEEAWQKDMQWKQKTLGLPSGLRPQKFGNDMFDVMLKEGVEVPVAVGDATKLVL